MSALAAGIAAAQAPSEPPSAPDKPAAEGAKPVKPPVDEATRQNARALTELGIKLYIGEQYAKASSKLEEAFALASLPSTGMWSARAFEKLGKLVEAADRYQLVAKLPKVADEPAEEQAARGDAERARAQLMPRVPLLHVQVLGANRDAVAVTLDLVPVARVYIADKNVLSGKRSGLFSGWKSLPANPGRHALQVVYGKEVVTMPILLQEGQAQEAVLRVGKERIIAEQKRERAAKMASCQGDCRKDCEEDQGCFRKCKRACVARHSPSTGEKTID
jgi:hypothetical protein